VVGIRSALSFVPTQIPGCLVWLRGDLGITLSGASVSGWADQSGNTNNASQSGAAQPPYNPTAASGLPAIQGNGSTYMTTPSIASPANITMLSVVQPLATTQSIAARIVEQSYATSYFMGANLTGVEYKLIVANTVSPFGLANTGTVQLAPSLVSATYNNSTGSGTIYYNGAQQVSYPFSAVTGSLPLYIMRAAAGAASFGMGISPR